MSAAKHTPGPWNVGTSKQGREVVFLNGLPKQPGSLGPSESWIDCNTEANARLIAAAPELLEFVKDWLERQGTDNNYMVAKARAAIAKAEGKS